MKRYCKNCGLAVVLKSDEWTHEKIGMDIDTQDDGHWTHDTANLDIMTSCMLPADKNGQTPKAQPVDEGVAVVQE